MDDGPLSRVLCEDVQENDDHQPEVVSHCCACDEAKYEVKHNAFNQYKEQLCSNFKIFQNIIPVFY